VQGGIEQGEISGVPLYWKEAPGPFIGALSFRVGVADEKLTNHGITHVVEHLALHRLGQPDYSFNGFVQLQRTMFIASGTESEVVSFLNSLSRSLRDLPTERLLAERGVLSAEASSRPAGLIERLLTVRYGTRGPGLLSYEELGLYSLGASDTQSWADEFFCKQNAVLWMTGPPPQGLNLELSDASSHSIPEHEPLSKPLPMFVSGAPATVTTSYLSERSLAASLGVQVLADRLMKDLRHDRGLSYQVSAGYLALDRKLAHLSISADVVERNELTVRNTMLQAFEQMSTDGPTEEELTTQRKLAGRSLDDADIPSTLDGIALRHLVDEDAGYDLRADLASLTVEKVAEAFHRAGATSILVQPDGLEPPAGFSADGRDEPGEVQGRRLRLKNRPSFRRSPSRLTISDDGITLKHPNGTATVHFEDCDALLAWSNGTRALYGSDGSYLRFRGDNWKDGSSATELVDDRLRDKRIQMTGEAPGQKQPQVKAQPSTLFWYLILWSALIFVRSFRDPKAPYSLPWVFGATIGAVVLWLAIRTWKKEKGSSNSTTQPDAGSKTSSS
jgi:zinc protease